MRELIKKYPELFLHQIHNKLKEKEYLNNTFQKTTFGKERDEKEEIKEFYKEIKKYNINDIISIDESSIQVGMSVNYGSCDLGKRCITKTSDNKVHRKYTMVSANNYNQNN